MTALLGQLAVVALALLVPVAATVVLVQRAQERRERAARPPRRTPVGTGGLELVAPGEADDAAGYCLRCPWSVSDPRPLAAAAALTEHVRARHGGIP